MTSSSFAKGTEVEFCGQVGEIRFIDDSYLTICLFVNSEDRVRDVCLVVQRWDWHKIKLIKESTK